MNMQLRLILHMWVGRWVCKGNIYRYIYGQVGYIMESKRKEAIIKVVAKLEKIEKRSICEVRRL